ncbi:MAG: class I SAM-dependent methyltransferase [Paracoccaceae bacterium]
MTDDRENLEAFVARTRETRAGDPNHRAYVGPPQQYDFMGATQFRLMTALGMREDHRLLDIGCGSLRAGKLFIQYLLPDRYFGIEPNGWLIEDAKRLEIGADIFAIKRPRFDGNDAMRFDVFGETFDYVVAQSIFSHTGADVFGKALAAAQAVLAPRGQFLFTVHYRGNEAGMSARGWFYPKCVRFSDSEVRDLCRSAGLHVQPLAWFHPRQRWFRAVADPAMLLDRAQIAALGEGRVLFDDRFSGQDRDGR